MNDFFSRLGLSQPPKFIKLLSLGLLAVIAFAFVLSLVGSSVRPFIGYGNPLSPFMGMMDGAVAEYGEVMPGSMPYGGAYPDMGYGYAADMQMASSREIAASMPSPMPPIYYGGTTGNSAEAFEVTDYSATIETRNLTKTCDAFTALKAEPYAIFESASVSDDSCSYTFKVEHARAEEVLAWLEAQGPKDLSESVYTIKQQVDDFTKEEEVLESKRDAIEATLASALSAYEEVTALATRTQDTETLAKIINSRIEVIERLTQSRINVNEQLDRLARAKSDQLDRLDYTYFRAYVYEQKFIDGEQLADSWKAALQRFVQDVNRAVQDATVGVLSFLIALVPFLLYIAVVIAIAKYSWKFVRKFWRS